MAGRGRDKGARGAHIRKSTLGTSNELSFSVLDAASNKKGRNEKKRAKVLGNPSTKDCRRLRG